MAPVVVELFGIPRVRAGVAEISVSATTARAALRELARACPALAHACRDDGSPAAEYLLASGDGAFLASFDDTLPPGARLLLMSADAGG